MRITVIGSGVIGLTTAIRLLRDGHAVRIVSDRPSEASTSSLAAAIWFPTHVGPPDRVARWGRQTYDVLAGQAAAGVPGVVMRQSLMLERQDAPEPDWAQAVRGVRRARPDELPAGYQHGWRFVVPMVEMPVHLPWLVAQAGHGGADFVRRRVGSLDEVLGGADVVVNCAGLAARQLAADPTVHPVRGQIVRVENPGLTMSVRDEHHPAGRAYVHPRRSDVILGGTLDTDEWDTVPDPATTRSIIERCADLVPALTTARVLAEVVGLRPGRPEVRLETEQRPHALVVHHYGHGGAGITLSWGCADEVAALLEPGLA